MSHPIQDQILALAGVFQSAHLVDQLAKRGSIAEDAYTTMLNSLLQTDAKTTPEVYGDQFAVRLGLREIIAIFSRQQDRNKTDVVRYALTLLYLEGKLRKRKDLMDILGQRIDQIKDQTRHFPVTHPNIVSAFAQLYKDTVSTFPQRIQVSGDPNILKVDENAEKIRALLLAGIRSAVLWRQLGGRRWKLLFTRSQMLDVARELTN